MMQQSDPHVVIIGAGLVGLIAAIALQRVGRKISIIESSTPSRQAPVGLNARSIALSYSSVQILRALGIWHEIKPHASAITQIHVSSRGQWGVARLRAADYQLEALGYVIENQALMSCLLAKLSQSHSIQLYTEAEFESLEAGDPLQLSYRQAGVVQGLSANLVLVADGAASKTRSRLGIEHATIDYQQSAIITNVTVSRPLSGMAYERFTQHGPLAILPLGQARYACIWTLDLQGCNAMMQLDDRQFGLALQRCFGFRLGYINQVGIRHAFPLQRTEAKALTKNRCLLIGNAANTLHPVAGQGLNLALRDIAMLDNLLGRSSLSESEEVGRMLAEYEVLRQRKQQQVVRIGDGLVGLFSNQLPLLTQVRTATLSLLDIMPPLKSEVAMAGMGFSDVGNRLLRGRMQ